MEPDCYSGMATDLLNAGMGDVGRLEFILKCIKNQKPLYNTDKSYLTRKHLELETKLETLSGNKKPGIATPESESDRIVDRALSRGKHTGTARLPDKKGSFLVRLFGRR